ncbi:MAG: DNA mismatch repair endonuclease MutL [Desulfobacteraceae bacterium]|nr:MAG: DNA mismatch repair endonuclease MutL [Desulfobacteraceae bacterium]
MGIVRVLHERVISQIAAGEVIERPASIVRELIDNSLDAESTRIHVVIEKGGKSRIRVSDNGFGMVRDDLILSIERHATSKITSVEELFSIRSLGFRGEALPSIGAVSKMEITSRASKEISGNRLKVSGGKLLSIDEVGCPRGTLVEVRDLFFNLPARRKFLKGDKTESDHIADLLARVGLPYNLVHFRLDEGDRTLINLAPCSDPGGRFHAVFGEVGASMTETSLESPGCRIHAWLGNPDLARSRADRLLLYVNQRHVRDKLLMHAVMEGYGQRLMRGRYPQVVLFLDVDPSEVDVNVHPAKHEVRLQQGSVIHQTVIAAVRKGLGRNIHPVQEEAAAPLASPVHREYPLQMAFEPPGRYAEPERRPEPAGEEREFRVVGQLRETYILLETPEGLSIMDQHAAHERVVYEALRRSYGSSGPEVQAFLIPQNLEFSLKDGAVLMDRLESLKSLGFELEPFGGTTFLLRSAPSLLINTRWEKFFMELIPALADNGPLDANMATDKSLTIMACHGAIRAGHRLSQQEMTNLVKQLFATTLPTNCPHGRPTLRRFSVEELEKLFRRTV